MQIHISNSSLLILYILYYEQFADGTIKCIEDEIPFELPEGWVWARLGTLAHYKKGPFGSSITKAMFVPESKDAIKVYEQKNAINKNDTLGNYFITNEKYEELKGFEVFPGDIIVSCAGTIGETFVMPISMRKGIINQALMKISLYNSSIKDFYLIYFDCKLKALANEQGYGMALKNIPPFDILKQYLVPLPPLPEQRRIIDKINIVSNVLTAIDNHIDKLSIDISNVKSKILDLAIRGKLVPQDPNDEPASVLLERIRAEKEELIKQGKIKHDKKESVIFKGDDNSYYEKIGDEISCIDDEIPFEIPENWCYSRLSAICWLSDGTKTENKPYPYWDVKALRQEKEPECRNNGKAILENAKVILVDGENSGEIFTIPHTGYIGSTFKTLENVNNIKDEYISLILRYNRTLFKENKTGSAVPHLNKNLFKSLIIALPPLNEQKQICLQVDRLFDCFEIIGKNII